MCVCGGCARNSVAGLPVDMPIARMVGDGVGVRLPLCVEVKGERVGVNARFAYRRVAGNRYAPAV